MLSSTLVSLSTSTQVVSGAPRPEEDGVLEGFLGLKVTKPKQTGVGAIEKPSGPGASVYKTRQKEASAAGPATIKSPHTFHFLAAVLKSCRRAASRSHRSKSSMEKGGIIVPYIVIREDEPSAVISPVKSTYTILPDLDQDVIEPAPNYNLAHRGRSH